MSQFHREAEDTPNKRSAHPRRTYRDFLVHRPGFPIRRPFTIDRSDAA